MRILEGLRSTTLGAVAAIMTLAAFAMIAPYLPFAVLHAQQTGPAGVPGASSGGGAVSSVFGRTGAVVAASGDYTATQVTNAAATNAANTFTADQLLELTSPAISLIDTYNSDELQFGLYQGYGYISAPSSEPFFVSFRGFGSSAILTMPDTAVFGFGSSTTLSETPDTALSRVSAGVLAGGNGTQGNSSAIFEAAALEAGGTVFTVASCGTPTATGGATAGTFAAGSATCSPVITTGKTASHGYACNMHDLTTASATLTETAYTTTTVTFTGSGVTSGDTILLGPCELF